MKRLLTAVAIIALSAGIVYGAGFIGKDKGGNLVQDFMPSTNGLLEATKADMTLTVDSYYAVRFTPSVAVTYKLNGTGTGYLVGASVPHELRIPAGVTSVVFSAASSASNKVYYQAQ